MFLLTRSLKVVNFGGKKKRSYILGFQLLQKAAFNLSSQEIGFLLSLFSYGYIFTPVGGFLATIYGGATLFVWGIAGNAVLVLLTPSLMRYQMWMYSVSRIIQGIFQVNLLNFFRINYLFDFHSFLNCDGVLKF